MNMRVLLILVLLMPAWLHAAITYVAMVQNDVNSTSISLTIPATTIAGDFMIVQVAVHGVGGVLPAITPPTGWTSLRRTDAGVAELRQEIFYKFASSTEPGTAATWTIVSGGSNRRVTAGMMVFRGVDSLAPIDAESGQANASSTSVTAPSITTTSANTMLVGLFATARVSNFSALGGLTERFDNNSGGGGNGTTAAGGHALLVAAGATGTRVATAADADDNIGQLVALRQRVYYEYRMEDGSWSGTSGEVKDSSGNNVNGQSGGGPTIAGLTPARSGNPGTCTYGVFDGLNDYLEIPGIPSFTTSFTVTAWIRTNDVNSTAHQRIFADDNNDGGYAISLGDGGPGRIRFFSRGITPIILDSNAAVTNNTWYFVAAVADMQSQRRTIYVYNTAGALVTSIADGTAWTGTWTADAGNATIGGETAASAENGTDRRFRGNIDEVRVLRGALGVAEIIAIRDATHPCPLTDHLSISNSGTGVTCQAETVTLRAHNSSHAIDTSYGATVNLTTSTNLGDWSLVTGSGTLNNGTVNDGAASYTFAGADSGSVTLALKHTSAGLVNIGASDGTITETTGTATAADDVNINFVNSGFRFIDAASVENIGTQIAGKDSDAAPGAQTLYLQAIRTDTNTGACVGVFANGANVSVGLASRCVDPVSCSAGKNIAFTNNGVTTAIAANNNASPLAYTSVNLLFGANSSAAFKFNSPDVGRMSLHAMYNIPLGNGAPSGNLMLGASNPFVVKPFGFVLSNIVRTADNFANPGAANAAGAAFIKAGDPFSATVTAIQMNGTAAPNYGREVSAEGVTLTNTLVGGLGLTNNPGLANPSTFGSFTGGVATGTTFSWGDVGIITLTPSVADGDYLGVGNVGGTTTGNIGRFIPHHFALSGSSLTNRNAASCAPASTFTYMSEALGLGFTLTAQNASNATTQNYTTANGFAKLNGSVPASFGFGAINVPGVPLTARLDTPSSSGTWSAGAGNFTANVGILRAAAPDGPYANVRFGTAPVDSDGVALTSFDLDADNNGSNERRLIGTTQIRYGRVAMRNAYGSELLALHVPASAQFYNGAAFQTNALDSCTRIPVPVTGPTGIIYYAQTAKNQLANPETSATLGGVAAPGNGVLSSGDARLRLAAPGAGNFGFADIVLNVPNYLQYDWDGNGTFSDDPRARARFGLFRSRAEFIYLRESY